MQKRYLAVAIAAATVTALAVWSGIATAQGGSSSRLATHLKPGARGATADIGRVRPDGTKLLYTQLDNVGGNFWTNQNFEVDFTGFDDQSADDFTVPASQTWNVTQVDIAGTGAAPVFNVSFYADGGGVPGGIITTLTSHKVTVVGNVYTIKIPAVTLAAGSYWVSVYSNSAYVSSGQWYEYGRSVVSGNPAMWRSPVDAWGTGCTNWSVASTCFSFAGPDTAFDLRGHLAV
jgi:hypothetical protein